METKKCTKCGDVHPLSNYYTCKTTKDGRQSWCVPCYKAIRPSGKEAHSTARARQLLAQRGIPCFTGKMAGKTGNDLSAWACVPIEAKASIFRSNYQYRWTLSLKQSKEGFDGLFFLIADLPDGSERVFIIPGDVEWIAKNYGTKTQQLICVTFDSKHGNARYWELMKPYENAYHLIEEYRIQASDELRGLI